MTEMTGHVYVYAASTDFLKLFCLNFTTFYIVYLRNHFLGYHLSMFFNFYGPVQNYIAYYIYIVTI